MRPNRLFSFNLVIVLISSAYLPNPSFLRIQNNDIDAIDKSVTTCLDKNCECILVKMPAIQCYYT